VTVRYTSAALEDLGACLEYLNERSPRRARALADRIEKMVDLLGDGWLDGPEQTLDGERVRSWALPPLRIYYQRVGGTMIVLRIYDQRRRPLR
jgi:plasmid stabilization system protein ParE